MFSRPDKKNNKQPDNFRGKIRADQNFDLNPSIGNQAMIENLDQIPDDDEPGRGSFLDLSIHPREDKNSDRESVSEKNKPKEPVKDLIVDLLDDAGNQNNSKNELIEDAEENGKEDNKDLLIGLEKLPDEDKDKLADNLIEIGDEQKNAGAGIADLISDDMSEGPDWLDRSMVAEPPKRRNVSKKKGSGSKKSAKKTAKKRSGNSINDLRASEEDMAPIKDWQFDAERLPERNRAGRGSKLLSRLAYYSGKTIGKVLGFIGNLLTFPYSFIYLLGKRGVNRYKNRAGANLQEKKDFRNIPGWDGAKFEKTGVDSDELDIDFRRVPDVWSYPIPDEAEKAPNKPRDPVFSVYICQPVLNEDRQMDANNNTGHSGIGIEFSRYSQISQKWERYNLRYGLFTQGGLPPTYTDTITAFHQATIPAQLMSEKDKPYDVSRSYPVKNRQVNKILRASQLYADKGYNNYTRNCTTFAKEMAKIAKVPGAESLFAREDIDYSNKANKQIFAASMITTHSKAAFSDYMTKLTHGNDYNYQGFGNKRATREEYDRYKNSLTYFKSRPGQADMPNAAAENLRRDSRWKTGGTIGSFQKKGDLLDDLVEKLPPRCNNLLALLQEITPEGQLDGNIPTELSDILDLLEHPDPLLNGIEAKLYTPDEMKTIRTGFTDFIKKLNLLLFKYYKNDRRIHYDVMALISMANDAIYDIDGRYAMRFEDAEVGGGDLGTLRNDTLSKTSFHLQTQSGVKNITMSELEGWMQIYKDPKAAVEAAKRYYYLEPRRRTGAEDKELQKLSRMHDLAVDFSSSHRYMLEKEKFSQQDMDYAFALEKKEKIGLSADVISEGKTSSAVYQSLFLEQVFKGMKDRAQRFISENHIDGNTDEAVLSEWLDNDMAECLKDKTKGNAMEMIIRAIDKSLDGLGREELLEKVLELIKTKWISRLFVNGNQENQDENLIDTSEHGNGPDQLLKNAFDTVSMGGKMTRQMDACILRALSQK